jgi:endoglucanase
MRMRAAVVGLLLAALVSVGFVTAGPVPSASAAVSVELAVQQILTDTNAIRAELGLRPLIRNAAMDSVAQNWTQTQANNGAMSHNPSLGSQLPAGWTRAGENVARGYSYTYVVTAWRGSSGHYANMIGDYTDIGIGYVEKNGTKYYTQDFAKYSRPGPVAPIATPTPGSAPIPKVSGNLILDTRTGEPWVPHAVNWPSFEYACRQGWGYSQDGATDAAAAAMVTWGINAVRLPLNEQCWLGVEGAPAYGTASGYRAAVRTWVDALNAHGIVVILDLHWSAPVGKPADGQRAMPATRSVLFWQSVATAFSKVPSVIFDPFNEPYSRSPGFTLSWDCWKNGGCQAPVENDVTAVGGSTFTVVGMKTLVTTIRRAGATQPIMLAGIDYANDLRGWLANKPTDAQLIASWHNYPGQRCSTVTCWNAEILPVAAVVPVIASEFGQTDGGSSFLTTFMTWADAHGVGYAPWAWWVVDAAESLSASRYALITDNETFSPKAPAGTALHDHLATMPMPVAPPPPRPPSRSDEGEPEGPVAAPPVPVVPGDGATSRTPLPGTTTTTTSSAKIFVTATVAPTDETVYLEKPAIGLWQGE